MNFALQNFRWYICQIGIYFTKEILEDFCLENIKIKFKEDGPSLEGILLQFAKFKLNSVYRGLEDNNQIKLKEINK